MDLRREKILVTGADGFIGSHLMEELVKQACAVRALVFYNSFNSWGWLDDVPKEVRDSIEVYAGDIRNADFVRRAVRGCSVVMHLAALVAIPHSYCTPEAYVDTNIKGTLNVLQAARDFDVSKIVHTSTSEVYGTAQYVPIREDHPLRGQSPYSATKIGADHIALSFYYSFDTPVAVIRPFNTYGPRQSSRAVIPTIITQLASGRRSLKLGAVHPTRDFNYIADTVRGFVAMAESDQTVGEVVNVASGYEISIENLARLISEIMNADVTLEVDEERLRPANSEVERLCGDNSKARRLLNWEPTYAGISGLRRGLEETIKWFTEPRNLQKYKTCIYNI